MMKYVFDGNRENDRQLNAALYVRPVSKATAVVPPSSSMTSTVVESSSMTGSNNPNSLGNQAPKEPELPSSPIFFNNSGMPRPIVNMPEPGTQADRARRIREAMGYQTQKAFAQRYGFSPNQWNNFERGSPISRMAAQSLARQIPGLSVGWILENETGSLSLEMARKLGVLPPAAE